MENIIFFVVVALVGLVQLVMRILEARNNAQAEKKPAPPIRRAPAETEEERVRKFFEALGVPSTSTPPPRVQPPLRPATERAPRPKRTIMPVDPFPIPRAGQPVPPAVAGAPPFPVSPVVPRESVPLPTRETSVFADLPIPAKPPHRLAAEFEVRNIDEGVAEDLTSSLTMPEVAPAHPPARPRAGRLIARLATADGLRDAMVLREIFGPPRSMRGLHTNEIG